MYNVVIVLIVIAAILLTLIVLIQESKGGGLASGFAASNSIMGVRRTTDIIEKTTWGLAVAIVILSVASAYLVPQAPKASVIMQQETSVPSVPSMPAAQPNATQLPTGNIGAAPAATSEQPSETPAVNK